VAGSINFGRSSNEAVQSIRGGSGDENQLGCNLQADLRRKINRKKEGRPMVYRIGIGRRAIKTKKENGMSSRAVSVYEAAQRLSVSVGTIRKYIRLGQIQAVRLGRRVLIPVESLDKLLK
jgi:excisionase family DNA binding protein